MMRRNGGMAKVVGGVIAFFALVYFIYLYNDLSGQLKNTERSAERYRREQESVSAQLQDQMIAKDQLKQRCDNDKEQMTNRLNSLQQQYKMLKSQHEDMETEFGRLQNEKEKETEDHRKQDEERAVEYNQFKQEKSLEIASLKDAVANLEREKEQLTQQVNALKSQLQGTLDLVQQAQAKQQQIEQQYQHLQQQQQIGGQQGASVQGAGQQGVNMQAVNQQQGGNMQAGDHLQGGNMQFGGAGFNPQQQQQPVGGGFLEQGLNQVQGAYQGFKHNLPNKDNILGNLVHGGVGALNPNILHQQPAGNVQNNHPDTHEGLNLADDIMKSLQEKHKPVDADILEEQQKQHQIIPPADHNPDTSIQRDKSQPRDLGHQKHGQEMLGQDGHGIQQQQQQQQHQQQQQQQQEEQHQIGKPNLENLVADNAEAGHTRYKVDPADVQGGNHDNRIQNQGPVNLQVQEPNLHGEQDKNQMLKEDELHFRPHIPAPDNQMQPQLGIDDSMKQEQLDIPIGQHKIQEENHQLGERNIADEDDDDRAHLPVFNAGRV